jgi:hypothetical protein
MAVIRDRRHNSGAYVGAAILIVIGVCALVGNLAGSKLGGDSIPLAMGIAFMAGYVATRRYGYLVPACILAGLGAGILVADMTGTANNSAYVVIGGGFGFLLIYGLDVLAHGNASRWWPLVPGGLMLVTGSATAADNVWLIGQLAAWSPVLLIALGLLLLVTQLRKKTQ